MNDRLDIKGFVRPGLENVIDAFAGNFERGDELGARFSAYREGELVADLWAGWADREKSEPFGETTLCGIFSSGKAAMATLVAEAVSRGELDYEMRIAALWPEFAAGGKDAVTLAMALSHQAGLCGFAEEMSPADWIDHDLIAARLAAMAPLWKPGSASGYHPQTIGYIVNETLRRAGAKTIGAKLREKNLDIYCGMRADEIARAAFMAKPQSAPVHRDGEFTKLAFLKRWSAAAKISREAWLAAEIPASNMHATARALAAIIHPLANGGVDVDGVRTIDPDTVAAALRSRISGDDLVLPFHIDWTAGLMKNTNGFFGPRETAFGHAGFGGSAAMIDPARKISAAYVMNRMSPSLAGDLRAVAMFSAINARD